MKASNASPIQVAGWAGLWSFVMSTVVLLPLEDTRETFRMVASNSEILVLTILSVAVYAIWSLLALYVTKRSSAVARMVFEQLTIVVVWGIQLAIHWGLKGTRWEARYGKAGEEWTPWSWLQLAGFAVMVLGACVYQKAVTLPCLGKEDHALPVSLAMK